MRWEGQYWTLYKGEYVERRRLFSSQRVPLFDFHSGIPDGESDPLRLVDGETVWTPNRTFKGMDFGSVPLWLQGIVSPLCSPRGFPLHDSGYEFHGLWQIAVDGTQCFIYLERKQVDDLLFEGMRADGCSRYLANKAWLAVRAAGGSLWDTHSPHVNLRAEWNQPRRESIERKVAEGQGME
jgi:hypothetical protein